MRTIRRPGRDCLLAVLGGWAGAVVIACGSSQPAPQRVEPAGSAQGAGECPPAECPPATDASGNPYVYTNPKTRTATPLEGPPGVLAPCPDGHARHGYTGRCLRKLDNSCRWEVKECPPSTPSAPGAGSDR